ncbi:MAG: peptidoglycan editing factor PgeF [Pseudomonadota bacterium]
MIWPSAPPHWVRTDVSTRHGGHSLAPWDSFNLAFHTQDNPEHVTANRAAWAERMGVTNIPLLDHVHGTAVVRLITEASEPAPACTALQADGAWTTASSVVCSVLTGDCLPILLCSKEQRCVAAVHAGWRGLVQGVVQNACRALADYGPMMAWLGPCHCGRCYAVQQDMKDTALAANSVLEQAFTSNPEGGYLFDLQKAAQHILLAEGVKEIAVAPYCTREQNDLFYSHRCAAPTGRQGTAIWIAAD